MEPVAFDSTLETSTAFWLCNVQSQPWLGALGCPGLVMGPDYVFRRPWGEKSVCVGGEPVRSTATKETPTVQPPAAREQTGSMVGKAEVQETPPSCSGTIHHIVDALWPADLREELGGSGS